MPTPVPEKIGLLPMMEEISKVITYDMALSVSYYLGSEISL
jgi:hypothetical protein